MAEFDEFERQVAAALVVDADEAIPTFDAMTVARTAIGRARGVAVPPRWRRPSVGLTGFAAAAAALLMIALLTALLQPRLPSSGGPSSSPGTPSVPARSVKPVPPLGAWVPAAEMTTTLSAGLAAVLLPDGS